MRFLLLFNLLFIATAAAAQQPAPSPKPNFSGEWMLESQTDRKGGLVRQDPATSHRLMIDHNEPEIKFTFLSSDSSQAPVRSLSYYTDGRGETNESAALTTNPGKVAAVTVKSKSKWQKNKLVVRGDYRQLLSGRAFEVKQDEEWELEDDGSLVHRVTLKMEDTAVQIQGGPRERSIVIAQPPVKRKSVYRKV